MKTFCVQTLGCKVNHYESEQVAAALRARGLVETSPDRAELRIINSCSVTVQAASQSRQATRRMTRLPVLPNPKYDALTACEFNPSNPPSSETATASRARVLVMGCWATSDKAAAASLPGVDAVLTHGDNVAAELDRLLAAWGLPGDANRPALTPPHACVIEPPPDNGFSDGWMMKAGSGAGQRTTDNKTKIANPVNEKSDEVCAPDEEHPFVREAASGGIGSGRGEQNRDLTGRQRRGTNLLPLLGEHQSGRQRAFLKIQDGCDAHCTYCIIPKLRPGLFSKPVEDVICEARRLVEAGHVEIVLTGIFLGAYGQPTALRRRQPSGPAPLAQLVDALCKNVPGLRRLRLSSLEPGDLTDDLLAVLGDHEQVVPHFHLPLQSGSDALLRRMNRQYRRDDFLRMLDRVAAAFDRPALTTDIIVGFPGEGESEFARTVEVVERAGFIHVHAFPYSPRPGTAAARWQDEFIRGPVVNERINYLRELANANSLRFRSAFVGQTVEVIVERGEDVIDGRRFRHGRCKRYFPVHFEPDAAQPGDVVCAVVESVMPQMTIGSVCSTAAPGCVPPAGGNAFRPDGRTQLGAAVPNAFAGSAQ
ncbi:MAG TPA: MiaB/RimO family radical SAM methylthiotransferase [Tepidisphaeraceae bacterium]|jgi:threonylcarbamoyladenosine tRNA methylthiotransferase MtaB